MSDPFLQLSFNEGLTDAYYLYKKNKSIFILILACQNNSASVLNQAFIMDVMCK